MADYREHYAEIRAAGATVVAVSVDAPEMSERVRTELRLPFAILCDTERRVVQDWDIYNPHEHGGIAKPSVFIIGRDRVVRYCAVGTVSNRVPASEVVRVLRTKAENQTLRSKRYIPRFAEWFRAIRSNFQR